MSKNLEIERKFILKNVPTFTHSQYGVLDRLDIQQTYLDVDGTDTRFRRTFNQSNGEVVYHQCVKKLIDVGTYEETEYEVTEEVWKMSLNERDRYLTKTRYVYEANGLKWEIDKYHGIVLVTLEVELEDINQEIEIPDFIQNEIIIEVTGWNEFTNYNLAEEDG